MRYIFVNVEIIWYLVNNTSWCTRGLEKERITCVPVPFVMRCWVIYIVSVFNVLYRLCWYSLNFTKVRSCELHFQCENLVLPCLWGNVHKQITMMWTKKYTSVHCTEKKLSKIVFTVRIDTTILQQGVIKFEHVLNLRICILERLRVETSYLNYSIFRVIQFFIYDIPLQ